MSYSGGLAAAIAQRLERVDFLLLRGVDERLHHFYPFGLRFVRSRSHLHPRAAPEATDVPFGLETAVVAHWRARVASDLNLTADQAAKIRPLLEETGRVMDALRRKAPFS